MKKTLKIIGAVCLGVAIWMIGFVCVYFALKARTREIADKLGITATEAKTDTADSQEKSEDEGNTELTLNVTGNPFSMQESGQGEIYYDSMQEALLNATIALELEEQYRRHIDEEIKTFENDKYALIFYRSVKDKKEEAYNYVRFNVRIKNGRKTYQFEQMRGSIVCYNSIFLGNAREVIENYIIESGIESIGINPEEERFIYGEVCEDFFEEGESIENLKIEGQKPDEIIEYESFGKTWYFWYYNDLQSDKKYDELEFTIKEE